MAITFDRAQVLLDTDTKVAVTASVRALRDVDADSDLITLVKERTVEKPVLVTITDVYFGDKSCRVRYGDRLWHQCWIRLSHLTEVDAVTPTVAELTSTAVTDARVQKFYDRAVKYLNEIIQDYEDPECDDAYVKIVEFLEEAGYKVELPKTIEIR